MTDPSEKMTALVQLAGTMAHELNNIFTAVTGNLSLLDQRALGSEHHADTVEDIVRAAQRGIDLTSKLQAFAGRQRLNRRHADMNEVVARTMRDLRATFGSAELKVTISADPLPLYVDEEKLSGTIRELIKNARAALPQTGGQILVETLMVEKAGAASFARLCIRDNGKGMSAEVMARATEPLFTTCPNGIRSGWGLSQSAGFIRQSGGCLSLSSELGQGTLVEILLPLQQAQEKRATA